MTLHVQSRPFPGHVPAPPVDPHAAANRAIAAGECRACDLGWRYERKSIGRCCVCGEPCRSWDPDDRPRHPTCEVVA